MRLFTIDEKTRESFMPLWPASVQERRGKWFAVWRDGTADKFDEETR